jgi:hypothetical protein
MITCFLAVNNYEGPAFILAITAVADAIIACAIAWAYVATHVPA